MKLGLIRYKYDLTGGAERVLGLLAQGMVARGHEVHVVASAWQGQPPDGVELHQVAPAKPAAWAVAAGRTAESLGLDAFLSLERVPGSPVFRAGDGVHAAWLKHRAPYEGLLKRLSFGLNPKHRAILDLERRTLAAPELRSVIAVSHMVAEELKRNYQVPDEKIRVVYSAVDEVGLAPAREPAFREQAREDLGLEPGQPALLFLGSGWERKGLEFALAALAQLPEAILLVAGRDRPKAWQAKAATLGVSGRVRFLGLQAKVAPLLASADVMVLPTIYDPCSVACLEALACGTPVVTTASAGAGELVEEGVSGVVVPAAGDVDSLSQACLQALALGKGFASPVSSQEAWLDQIMALIEAAAS
ncbi:MAG: glycosyltransferase family 4 protein [Desulfarculaceae bacterium]|nr:glycosyltransferase family 4 protein [Desulfarculaceae bacterium]MCF8072260.1 glycosyltransferase family 4 protein [Desulfarculaceae bacterium]MCF8100181.1 glycosyltransferase family 4 protein [Desulfarculaceae bacterium]MCF8117875.1 glycosyltransferase family 4 protein [Desulfarculaceae bacterium]